MVGNKHKNGIICMFPGCEKTMRTQKFKIHFTKAHLKQGEVYTVEHRRRFEVAREDNGTSSGGGSGGGGSGSTPVSDPTAAGDLAPELEVAESKLKMEAALSEPHVAEDEQDAELVGHPPAAAASDLMDDARHAAELAWPMPKPVHQSSSPEATAGAKRPLEDSAESGAAASSALLVEFVALMDRRFQELVGKMGEMLEVQKELIDALKGKSPTSFTEQAPALALASAAESVMRKRAKTSHGEPSAGSSSGTSSALV